MITILVGGFNPFETSTKWDADIPLAGWWFQPTPLKNMKVSWDDDIPNIWKTKFMFQTTKQLYNLGLHLMKLDEL